ncbi:MAG: hypothetical protein K6U11_09410 [bacterium]|nr:hypothetical protein [bacterium]
MTKSSFFKPFSPVQILHLYKTPPCNQIEKIPYSSLIIGDNFSLPAVFVHDLVSMLLLLGSLLIIMFGDITANTFDLKGEEWAIEPSAAGE